MFDFAAARTRMVDGQLRPNDVTDWPILDAMGAIPREEFVPAARRELAYIDVNLALQEDATVDRGRSLIQPVVLARLLQAATLSATDSVLTVGCVTGYGAAVLAALVRRVVALDEDEALVGTASATLQRLGIGNVLVVHGPLAGGCPAEAPFDAIVFEGAVEFPPDICLEQLGEGGRLVLVEGTGQAGQAMLYRRTGAEVSGRPIMNASVPLLPGFAKPRVFQF